MNKLMSRRHLFQALSLAVVIAMWGCSGQNNQGLSVSVNPSSPLVIPIGSPPGNGSATGPTPPYFTIQAMTLTWTGSQKFQLLAINFYASNLNNTGTKTGGTSGTGGTGGSQATAFNCAGSGTQLAALFSTNVTDCTGTVLGPAVDSFGNINIPAPASASCPNSLQSVQFACGSLPITVSVNPFAHYNIPIEVVVFGQGLNNAGFATGRIAGTTNIVTN